MCVHRYPSFAEQEACRRKRMRCAVVTAVAFVVVVLTVTIATSAVIVGRDDDAISSFDPTPGQPQVFNGNGTSAPPTSPVDNPGLPTCNGLSNLCDVPVNEILFATMHNANSDAGSVLVFPNHNQDMVAALQAGVRGLNVDIGICDDQLSLVHGLCLVGFSNLVQSFVEIVQFLVNNPNEVLIMPTQINDDTGGVVDLAQLYTVMQQDVVVGTTNMADLLYAHPGPGTSWPTLGELIEMNKRILFFRYNGSQNCGNTACPPGFHDWFAYAAETEFEFEAVVDIINDTARSCQITRGSSGTRDFFGINMFSRIPTEEVSAQVQKQDVLLQHLETCSRLNENLRPNLAIVDFWATGDVVETVQRYNSGL